MKTNVKAGSLCARVSCLIMPGDAAAIDLGVLQQQLQTHRSSLADQIMQHLPDQTSTPSHAPQPTPSTRRPATLGVGASTSHSNSYSAADHKFRAQIGAKAGMKRSLEDRRPAAQPEEDDERDSRGSAAQKRARPPRRMDVFAAAEAKIKAGKEKAQVHDVPPHVATMSKAQRKKWNKQQRLAASEKSSSPSSEEPPAMTPLQSSMLASLQGARFRSINERLYTHPSRDALAFMQDDPQLFDDYHAGFRQQVRKWPKNPVDKIAELLTPSKKAKSTHRIRAASIPGALVVDMGAGEGGLAKMLAAHGFHTLSYDLVDTPDGWVRGLDAAALHALPLPGIYTPLGIVWDRDTDSITAASTVDVVVFCLSLMGTNWVDMICEAWRVLKPNGEMVIAEVTSRLGSTGDTHAFTELLCALGFHVDWVDTTNTHFVLLTCTKTVEARQADTSQPGPTLGPTASPSELRRAVTNAAQANDARATLVQLGADVLKPCWYKRR